MPVVVVNEVVGSIRTPEASSTGDEAMGERPLPLPELEDERMLRERLLRRERRLRAS